MEISVIPSALQGSIKAIPSKSAAHRLLICAALADRETEISCPVLSKDILATAHCLQAMGAKITHDEGYFMVKPIEQPIENAELDCGESGSSLRFLLPVVCALGISAKIKMAGRLPERPLSPLWEELERHGAKLSRPEENIIQTAGKLRAGEYRIRGDISSQFISGLLFALPLLKGESRIIIDGGMESEGYVHMTLKALENFSVTWRFEENVFSLPENSPFISPCRSAVEGDWSNAAFWLVADALSPKSVEVTGLLNDSMQGDKAVLYAINQIKQGNGLIDTKNIPDLVPVLSVLAALSPGETRFINAGRLRMKESDRLKAISNMLSALGGHCEETADSLIIKGIEKLKGGVVDSANDHRIAMSAAIAAIGCKEPVTILGAEAVEKSYPDFFEDYKKLGGILQ